MSVMASGIFLSALVTQDIPPPLYLWSRSCRTTSANVASLNHNCKIESPERNRVAYAPWFLSFFVLFDQLSDVWDFKLTVIVMPCDDGKQQMSGKTGI